MAGLHSVHYHFLVMVLGVEHRSLQGPYGLHPLGHLRVTVSHLKGLRGYRLPMRETLDKENRSHSVGVEAAEVLWVGRALRGQGAEGTGFWEVWWSRHRGGAESQIALLTLPGLGLGRLA